MKRRVIKKNVSRFITPLIKDLPRTVMRGWEVDNGDGTLTYFEGKNHSIRNGFVTPEGTITPNGGSIILSIKRTAESIKKIRSEYSQVFLRIGPEYNRGRIYMRLITEKVPYAN
jgi:hypothetical protein